MITREGEGIVFLLSMPRSGSTLLGMMLSSHPEIHCPPEPWIQLPLAELVSPEGMSGFPYDDYTATIATADFLRSIASNVSTHDALIGELRTFLLGGRLADKAASFSTSIYNLALIATGKNIFVDKTPRYYHALDFIKKNHPAAKFIVLRRDPMDIACSYKTTWGVQVAEMTGQTVTPNTIDFSRGLYELQRLSSLNRPDILSLSYEGLVADPETSLKQICTFLAIDYSPRMLTYYDNANIMQAQKRSSVGDRNILSADRKTDTSSVGKWEKEFTQDDLSDLLDFLGADIFVNLGYQKTLDKVIAKHLLPPEEKIAANLRESALLKSMNETGSWQVLGKKWSFLFSCLNASPYVKDELLDLIVRMSNDGSMGPINQGKSALGLAQKLMQSEENLKGQRVAIEDLKKCLKKADQERTAHLGAIEDLTNALKRADQERTAHLGAIEDLTNALKKADQKLSDLMSVMMRFPVKVVRYLFRIKLPNI